MKLELPTATPAWRRLRRAQQLRSIQARHELPKARVRHLDAARLFWSRRAWSEYAAIPAVSQVMLALVREGSALESLSAYSTIAADEARHAELSHALAEQLGGYEASLPDESFWNPRGLAVPSDVPVVTWVLANGCVSETVSLALIRARLAKVRHAGARAVLAQTAGDEAVHVAVGWQVAGELLPRLPQSARRELGRYVTELFEMVRCTFGTSGLPSSQRRIERAIRDETARAGLGSLPAAEEDAVVERSLGSIATRLGRLGVRVTLV